MTLLKNWLKLSAASAVVLVVASCSNIKLDKKGAPGKPQTAGSGQPAASGGNSQQPAASGQLSLTGDWQFGFQFENSTLQSSVHLDQQGQTFTGSGKDDQTGMQFTIEQGTLNGSQVQFYKKYSGNAPEVEYTGTLEMANDSSYNGPYMHGEYTAAKAGKIVSNIWEAELAPAGAAQPAPQPNVSPLQSQLPQQQAPPSQSSSMLDKTPELSGKWNVGYEYNFKTIHSTMWLEQDRDLITGHGIDHETGQKFVLAHGWYHYPKLTLILKWPPAKQTKMVKGKGKHPKPVKASVMVPERTMMFKARVSNVNDRDYQGPYLNGKTQGGGNWEAQMYK
jgi:hypothetical protein